MTARHSPKASSEPVDLAEAIRAKLRGEAATRPAADRTDAPTAGPAARGRGNGKAGRGGQATPHARQYAFRRS